MISESMSESGDPFLIHRCLRRINSFDSSSIFSLLLPVYIVVDILHLLEEIFFAKQPLQNPGRVIGYLDTLKRYKNKQKLK